MSPFEFLEFVVPQSFSFSKKRSGMLEENREEMIYEGPSGDQKKDHAVHTTAGLAPVDGRDSVASGDAGNKEVFGVLVKDR